MHYTVFFTAVNSDNIKVGFKGVCITWAYWHDVSSFPCRK